MKGTKSNKLGNENLDFLVIQPIKEKVFLQRLRVDENLTIVIEGLIKIYSSH